MRLSRTEATSSRGPIATYLASLSRRNRALFALVLGVLAAAAMPPFNLLPALIPSFSGLILLTGGARSVKNAFWEGFWWGMGFFVPGLHWLTYPFFVDIAIYWWLIPFAVLGLPAVLSVFVGGATALTRLTAPGNRPGRFLIFAAWFSVGEWLRGHVFTGFPWILIGYGWSSDFKPLLAGLQISSLLGIYGLSYLTALLATLPARLDDRVSWPRRLWPVVSGAVVLLCMIGWGCVRLQGDITENTGPIIRVVSTDQPHRAHETAADDEADFKDLLSLVSAPGLDNVSAEVWPEGIIRAFLNQNPDARRAVASVAPPNGIIITGTFHGEGAGATQQYWNSVAVIDAAANLLGMYDKHHLVPFGEYIPLRWLLPIDRIAASLNEPTFDPSFGTGPDTLPLPGLPSVGPIICYEAIFPAEVIDTTHRPGWMVNVSDDGWFGRGIGPGQHLAIARVRSVEEGLPMIRATNGGISGVFDSYGRLIASLPLGAVGVLDVALPQSQSQNTFYERIIVRLPYILWLLPIMASIALVNKLGNPD